MLDRIGEIRHDAIERHSHGAFGERGRDALGDVEAGRVLGEFACRAVRESECNLAGLDRFQIAEAILEVGHRNLLWLTPANERR